MDKKGKEGLAMPTEKSKVTQKRNEPRPDLAERQEEKDVKRQRRMSVTRM